MTSFCEQKEAKKLFNSGTKPEAPSAPHARARGTGSFWFFFSKMNLFLLLGHRQANRAPTYNFTPLSEWFNPGA
jgi:hypothetical protein